MSEHEVPAPPPPAVSGWAHVDFDWAAATTLLSRLDEAGTAVEDNWAARAGVPDGDEWEGSSRREFLMARDLEADRRSDLLAACDEQRALVEQAVVRAQAEQDRRELEWQAWQAWWHTYRPPGVAYVTPTGTPPSA